jgi:hypothetical protein
VEVAVGDATVSIWGFSSVFSQQVTLLKKFGTLRFSFLWEKNWQLTMPRFQFVWLRVSQQVPRDAGGNGGKAGGRQNGCAGGSEIECSGASIGVDSLGDSMRYLNEWLIVDRL